MRRTCLRPAGSVHHPATTSGTARPPFDDRRRPSGPLRNTSCANRPQNAASRDMRLSWYGLSRFADFIAWPSAGQRALVGVDQPRVVGRHRSASLLKMRP